MDELTGFPDAVKAIFPDTHIQHCIVHMIRNSTKFVSYKDLKAVCRDLKEVYSAINAEFEPVFAQIQLKTPLSLSIFY